MVCDHSFQAPKFIYDNAPCTQPLLRYSKLTDPYAMTMNTIAGAKSSSLGATKPGPSKRRAGTLAKMACVGCRRLKVSYFAWRVVAKLTLAQDEVHNRIRRLSMLALCQSKASLPTAADQA